MRYRVARADRSAGGGTEPDGRGGLPARATSERGDPARRMKPRRANERREASPPGVIDGSSGLRTRRTALEVLVRVARERAYADVLLGHRIAGFAAPDRRLITQIVLGTIA